MLTVPLYIELLRTRPLLLVWAAALAQGVLWLLVPALVYSAPPNQLADVLAIGREFQLGTDLGPPLAYWLAEIAFRLAGLFGVYLLAQICVVVTYWAVFQLGRPIVGDSHAAMAVLLMAGLAVFTVPTPDFGPGILAMPLWALALLHYWRAVGEGQRRYWIALGIELGLLLQTTYAGLILLALLLGFTLATERLRTQFAVIEPWIGGVAAVLIFFPHLIWLDQTGGASFAGIAGIDDNVRAWARVFVALLVGHAGLAVLVGLAYGPPFFRRGAESVFERATIDPVARIFVYVFALVPTFALLSLAILARSGDALVAGPLVLLSGLAVIVAAGDRIRLAHQRLLGFAWTGLLVLPPLLAAAAVLLLPWAGTGFGVGEPAAELGRFFGDNFSRRTGQPLEIVAGDHRIASLIALAVPGRPHLYRDATPERTPWVTRQSIAEKGALVVWSATDVRGTVPAALRERFPELTQEVPRAFAWRAQGQLPPMRIGWGVVRSSRQAAPVR